ncbi:AAA family ATPase [Sphingomonas sp. C8-2]|jgi:predicted ATP-dependent endonuclease of OLD family|nr:AAA family ATPase [Sphingomonas sp. C8-2]
MKLIKARVTNYRNILDSGEVEIGTTTCLVGKNEAGKTAFLRAIEGVNSTDEDFKEYGKTENYPRRLLADYEERHDGDEAVVATTTWLLDDSDVAAVEEELGKGALTSREITVKKAYNSTSTTWTVPIDFRKVLKWMADRFNVAEEDRASISKAYSTTNAAKLLSEIEERSAPQEELLTALKKFRGQSATLHAIDTLSPRVPKFLYFSHYDRMSGQISINQLAKDKQTADGIKTGDQVFLDFLEYAGTTLEELVASTRFEDLNARCEAAANRITDQIFEYWTQNDELQIQVLLTEGKAEDDPPFNSGPIARARVQNNLHRVSVPFSERSAGFIWFFSFLVKFAQIKKNRGNVIILLDEPGLTLHGTAQQDLLRYFEEQLAPKHQLIYSTHSPFMVPANDLASVRTVEDVVVRDERDRKVSHGTKIRGDVLTTDPQTNFPIFGAMGFEVTQGLVIAPNTLLVEGPSDILYLQAASSVLAKRKRTALDPRWAVCPSGGIDKVLPFVRLFYGNKLNVAVLTDFDRGQRKKLDQLYQAELLQKERIILATEIAGKEEADIEDFFDPALFVQLVNKAYDLKGELALTIKKLDEADTSTERLVKKAEAYFRVLPDTIPMFSHYAPALHLLKNPDLLDGDDKKCSTTLERFEAAFDRIAMFI